MADGAMGAPAGVQDGSAPARPESDFSPRKLKNAAVILLGQTFASSILPFMALSYVLPYMTREFGWSRTEFLLANSFLMWFGALTTWPMGAFTDRVGARPIILAGTLGVGVFTLLLRFVHNAPIGPLPSPWMFYVLFALLGVFGSSGAMYMKVISALFIQNRGKAMAVLGAEGTVARMFLPAATTWLLITYGWRGMFTTFGVAILAIVPVIFFFLDEPGRPGLRARLGRGRSAAAPPPASGAVTFEGMTFAEVRRDWVFWLMLLGGLVGMVVGNGMQANIPASFHDRGFSMTTIGEVDSVATLAGIPGVLLAGFLMDKVSSAKIGGPFQLVTALSAFLMMIVTPQFGGVPMLLASRFLFMFSFTAVLPLTGYLMTRFFGLRSYAQLYGFMSSIQAMCMGFAPPVFGHIYDVTHSYRLGYEALIVAALVSAAVFLILPRYRFSADIGAVPSGQEPSRRDEGVSPAAAAAE